jgi:hypothetical protein
VRSTDFATRNRLTSPDTRLAEIAGRQHGVVRTQDLRAAGDGAALDDRAAADLWRIRRGRPAPITVVSPRRAQIKGVVVHPCNRLDPRGVTIRNGIPVTTVSRTIVDLAETETETETVANVM